MKFHLKEYRLDKKSRFYESHGSPFKRYCSLSFVTTEFDNNEISVTKKNFYGPLKLFVKEFYCNNKCGILIEWKIK